MCREYYIDPSDKYIQEISATTLSSALLSRFRQKKAVRLQTKGIVERRQLVITLAPDKDGRRQRPFAMQWGIDVEDPLRERYTVAIENIDKDMRFRDDWHRHRCILPATYLLEHPHRRANDGSVSVEKKEYVVQPAGQEHIWIAGIYRIIDNLPHCLILMQEASGEYRKEMNEKIPVLIPEQRIQDWLTPETNPKTVVRDSLKDLIWEEWNRPTDEGFKYDSTGLTY